MKVKNQFLLNYILVFIITSVIAVFLCIVLGALSSKIESSLVKNKYTASGLMKNNIQEIKYDDVVKNNGGLQVIDKEYRVIFSKGNDTLLKKQLTVSEFTNFLEQSQSIYRKYSYSIAYNEKMNFWLIITFPTSLRIDFNITHNKLFSSSDSNMVNGVIAGVIAVYLVMLILSTLIYSRLTAVAVTNPLKKLKINAYRLSNADYSRRVNLELNNEIGELGYAFDKMADQIQNEIKLREKSENSRKQITLDIAHDLKNPLAVIMGYAEYCLNNPSQNNETYLSIIYQKSRSINILINRLFELSKLESTEYKPDKHICDIAEYLRMKCADMISLLEAAEFDYNFNIPEDELYIKFDAKEMDRVIDNIFENAIQYNERGTEITLELKDLGGNVQIIISDNGIGIPRDCVDSIFQPFMRADKARNSETGGSGLGLAIVYKIIKLHNGEIKLDSDLGKGCIFTISLPIN